MEIQLCSVTVACSWGKTTVGHNSDEILFVLQLFPSQLHCWLVRFVSTTKSSSFISGTWKIVYSERILEHSCSFHPLWRNSLKLATTTSALSSIRSRLHKKVFCSSLSTMNSWVVMALIGVCWSTHVTRTLFSVSTPREVKTANRLTSLWKSWREVCGVRRQSFSVTAVINRTTTTIVEFAFLPTSKRLANISSKRRPCIKRQFQDRALQRSD